jgi:hypothetical protein
MKKEKAFKKKEKNYRISNAIKRFFELYKKCCFFSLFFITNFFVCKNFFGILSASDQWKKKRERRGKKVC